MKLRVPSNLHHKVRSVLMDDAFGILSHDAEELKQERSSLAQVASLATTSEKTTGTENEPPKVINPPSLNGAAGSSLLLYGPVKSNSCFLYARQPRNDIKPLREQNINPSRESQAKHLILNRDEDRNGELQRAFAMNNALIQEVQQLNKEKEEMKSLYEKKTTVLTKDLNAALSEVVSLKNQVHYAKQNQEKVVALQKEKILSNQIMIEELKATRKNLEVQRAAIAKRFDNLTKTHKRLKEELKEKTEETKKIRLHNDSLLRKLCIGEVPQKDTMLVARVLQELETKIDQNWKMLASDIKFHLRELQRRKKLPRENSTEIERLHLECRILLFRMTLPIVGSSDPRAHRAYLLLWSSNLLRLPDATDTIHFGITFFRNFRNEIRKWKNSVPLWITVR